MVSKVKIRSIPFNEYSEHYASLLDCDPDAASLFRMLENLSKNNFKVIGVTLIGEANRQKEYKNISSKFPLLFLSHSIRSEVPPKSILLNFLGGKVKNFHYLKEGGKIIGSSFFSDEAKYLKIHTLEGKTSGVGANFSHQADSVYEITGKIMKRWDMPFEGIYRFWNFMDKISENYPSFNRSRNKFFEGSGIKDYPAATGVETKWLSRQEFSMGFEAVKPFLNSDIKICSLNSQLQCEASEYGPKFSRAKLLNFKKSGVKKLYISGTSSIDRGGNSTRADNILENVSYTLLCIQHLQEKSQMNFNNVVTSVVYVLDEEVHQCFLKLYKKNKWKFSFVVIYSNLCRNNLIFEMECLTSNKIVESGDKNLLRKLFSGI